MDRAGIETSNWSNPELVHGDDVNHSAAECELFDSSTIDPSHIIHLIRQLLPSGRRGYLGPGELYPAGSAAGVGESPSKVVETLSSGQNGVVHEELRALEVGVSYRNGIIHVGHVAGILQTKLDRGIEEDRSGTGFARASSSIEVSGDDLKRKGRYGFTQENGSHNEENGNHIAENGDLSNKRVREGGKVVEKNECSPDYTDNRYLKPSAKCSEATPISAGSAIAEGNVGNRIVDIGDEGHIECQLENDANLKTGGEEDPQEEAGCVLWDLAASESHAEFLVQHHILDVLLAFLRLPHSDRMREICLGVFGNLACHSGPVMAMVATEGLVATIVQQLFVEYTPSLTETCRLLSAGLHSEVTVTWVESIKSDYVLERIMWMAANTLNSQLLEKCTELILVMVDSRRDAAFVLLPSLLRLGLPGLLTDLIAFELNAISEGTSSRRDVVLDIVLQIAEAISIPDDAASQLAASDKLFSMSCQVIRLSVSDEIGPSGITATVLIANLLTEEAGLIQQVLQDSIFLGRLLALVPCAGDDPGARNALWSILARICSSLVSTGLEDPVVGMLGMISPLADGCSLLLDDLDIHQEDDIEEDKDQALAGHEAAASTSRGQQAKLATVCNLLRIMEQWTTVHGASPTQDMLLLRSVRNAFVLLSKYIATQETKTGSAGKKSCVPFENGGLYLNIPSSTAKS